MPVSTHYLSVQSQGGSTSPCNVNVNNVDVESTSSPPLSCSQSSYYNVAKMYASIGKNRKKYEKLGSGGCKKRKTTSSTNQKENRAASSLVSTALAADQYFNLSASVTATTKQPSCLSNLSSYEPRANSSSLGKNHPAKHRRRSGAHSQTPLNYERIFEEGGHYLESLSQNQKAGGASGEEDGRSAASRKKELARACGVIKGVCESLSRIAVELL